MRLSIVASVVGGALVGFGSTIAIISAAAQAVGANPAALIGLGLPLFLVTMASQNLPGFTNLRASGYTPPSRSILAVTSLASVVTAPLARIFTDLIVVPIFWQRCGIHVAGRCSGNPDRAAALGPGILGSPCTLGRVSERYP